MSVHSFRLAAVSGRAPSHFGGTARSAGTKGKKSFAFSVADPRVETSKTVLAGIEAVIRSQPGAPSVGEEISPAVYFAAILSALQTRDAGHKDELLYLLSTVIGHVSPATLNHYYGIGAAAVGAAMKEEGANDNGFRVLACVKCIGALLTALPCTPDVWTDDKVAIVSSLLQLTVDARQEIRTAAATALQSVLAGHHENKFTSLGPVISDFCHSVLRACSAKETVHAGMLVDFLKAGLPLLPGPIVASVCEAILRLFTLAAPRLIATSMSVMTNLLKSPVATLKRSMLRRLVPALLERKPAVDDSVCANEFLQLLPAAIVRLVTAEQASSSPSDEASRFPESIAAVLHPSITVAMSYLESDVRSVQVTACSAIGTVLLNCVNKSLVSAAVSSPTPTTVLHEVIATLGSFVQYRFKKSWPVCLPALGMLFRVVGESTYPLLVPLVSSLVELYKINAEAEDASLRLEDIDDEKARKISREQLIRKHVKGLLGAALRHMGLQRFTEVLPLKTPGSASAPGISDDRLWILHIIRHNLRYTRCSLMYFMNEILGAARECEGAARAAEQAGMLKAAKVCRGRSMLLWSLFPSFCVAPTDVPSGFNPQLGQLLTKAMTDERYPQLPLYICAGLKVLIHRNRIAAGHDAGDVGFDFGLDGETAPTKSVMHGGAGGAGGQKKVQGSGGSHASGNKSKGAGASKPGTEFGSIFAESFGVGASMFGASVDGEDREEGSGTAGIEGLSTVCHLPHISETEASTNLAVMAKYSKNFLPVLFNLYEQVSAKTGASEEVSQQLKRRVLEAIGMYACLASPDLIATFYTRLSQMFGEATQRLTASANPETVNRVSTLLSLAQALLCALSEDQALAVFKAASPYVLHGDHAAPQKRAYKLVLSLLKTHRRIVHTPAFLDELSSLLTSSLATCNPSAKRARLQCLEQLISSLNVEEAQHATVLRSFIGDVLLCVKDSSKRTRDTALDLLLTMAAKALECGEGSMSDVASSTLDLATFVRMLLAAMTTVTPHVRSAAVICIARVVYQHSDLPAVNTLATEVLPAVLLLFQDPSREVVKSAIMFLRVVLACLESETLKSQLATIVPALFASDECRNKLRARTRILLERLVQKFGADAILALVPAEDARLIRHIRKQKQRMDKKKHAPVKKTHEGFDLLFGTDDKTEAGDLRDDGDSDVDAGFTEMPRGRAVVQKRRRGEPMVGPDGKEITDDQIYVDLDALASKKQSGEDDDGYDSQDEDLRFHRKRPSSSSKSAASFGSKKRASFKETRDPGFTGARFKSQNAGGDVRRKGDKFEPFAYVPLDPRALSSKGGKKSVNRFKDVVNNKRAFAGKSKR